MIDKLLGASLHHRLAVIALAIVVAVVGYKAFSDLTIEAFPDPTDAQVQIITLYPGQPSEEVERRVSIPLERALNGVPGTIRQRSISLFGLSLVTLTFAEGVDTLVARQQVIERIPDANLPPGITPSLAPLATPITRPGAIDWSEPSWERPSAEKATITTSAAKVITSPTRPAA